MCQNAPADHGYGKKCIGRIASNAHRRQVKCPARHHWHFAYNQKALFSCQFLELSNQFYWVVEWNIGNGEGPPP
jgi:hypothetical protein